MDNNVTVVTGKKRNAIRCSVPSWYNFAYFTSFGLQGERGIRRRCAVARQVRLRGKAMARQAGRQPRKLSGHGGRAGRRIEDDDEDDYDCPGIGLGRLESLSVGWRYKAGEKHGHQKGAVWMTGVKNFGFCASED